jgi:hypothetical protein
MLSSNLICRIQGPARYQTERKKFIVHIFIFFHAAENAVSWQQRRLIQRHAYEEVWREEVAALPGDRPEAPGPGG